MLVSSFELAPVNPSVFSSKVDRSFRVDCNFASSLNAAALLAAPTIDAVELSPVAAEELPPSEFYVPLTLPGFLSFPISGSAGSLFYSEDIIDVSQFSINL